MGFFLPVDINERILKFLDNNVQFPFVREDEISAIFFLFGKRYGVKNELDMLSAKEITRKTIDQLKREMFLSKNKSPADSDSVRDQYQMRVLQIYVELQDGPVLEQREITNRISRDPTLLMYCYAHHVSYYRQKCFFEIYDPFKKDQIDAKLHDLLLDRMVMLSYNVQKSTDLPFSTLTPFTRWLAQ